MIPSIISAKIHGGRMPPRGHAVNYDELQRCTMRQTLDVHEGCVNRMSWNADGRLLASGSDDRTVVVWQLKGYQSQFAPITRILTREFTELVYPLFAPQNNHSFDCNINL